MKYHYFQRRPTYPVGRSGACASSGLKLRRSASGTHTGGEFGWGGTSVKK